ncbi:hybrid sensor histidine kinase/response regulator [Pseudomethylobacillus aquaticus]|uniref:hybrid sensor histidine kinase/response regulator n=1 Tax=Pseudomethylobacillus aquaticus TaxID=2676064 RepID=UPI0011CD8BF0|nr:response regulator [Pseudomethylobacillus aquaticus]
MENDSSHPLVKWLSALTLLLASTVLLGWYLHIEIMKSVIPGLVSMKINTAICFALLATLTVLLHDRHYPRLQSLLAQTVGLIAFATLLQFLFDVDFGIDQWFQPAGAVGDTHSPFPGRMSFYSAINFLLLTSAFQLRYIRQPALRHLSESLLLLAYGLPVVALLGYIFGWADLMVFGHSSAIALHTSLCFLMLTTAQLILLVRDKGMSAFIHYLRRHLVWIAVAVFAVSVLAVATNIARNNRSSDDVANTYEVILKLQTLVSELEHYRGDVRSYLLTGDARYYEVAKDVPQRIASMMADIALMLEYNPQQSARFLQVSRLFTERAALAESQLQLRRDSGDLLSRLYSYTSQADQYTQQMEVRLNMIKHEEIGLLSMRRQEQRQHQTTALITSGLIFLLSFVALIVAYLSSRRELQQRQLMQQVLQESKHEIEHRERFLRSVTDNIPSLVGYWDANLISRFANSQYEYWFGKRVAEVQGHHVSRVLGTYRYNRVKPFVEKALAGEPQRFEMDIRKPDGVQAHAEVNYIPDERDGQVHGFYVLISDITPMKQAQLQLEQLNQALEHKRAEAEAATLAKSQFLANMSHEIRTPMNGILGMLQLLRLGELNVEQLDHVNKAEAATRTLLSVVNDILDFSKLEADRAELDIAPFSMASLLHEVSSIVAVSVGDKPLELLFDIDEHLPAQLLGDDLRLRQVLINLLGNAIKFTAQGEVLLRIRLIIREVGFVTLRIEVVDTGIGITQAQREEIFEAFRQAEASTSRNYGGTGLGLAICKRLLKLMHTDLHVNSEPGKGSRFYFTLTLQVGQALAEPLTIAQRKGQRMLLIEDHPRAAELMLRQLGSLGMQAQVAGDADQAFRYMHEANQQGQPYQILIVDARLDGQDSWELCQRLQSINGNGTLLMVTGSMHDRSLWAARMQQQSRPVAGFLIKPVTVVALYQLLTSGAELPAHLGRPAKRNAQAKPLLGLRLLVVEDNVSSQEVVEALLMRRGAHVTIVGNGLQALTMIEADEQPFDLVLMDVQMPVMDGITATRLIREHRSRQQLPILAMTANVLPADKQACALAGMNDHVPKPFDLDTLVNTILRNLPPGKRPLEVTQDGEGAKSASDVAVLVAFAELGIEMDTTLPRFNDDAGFYLHALMLLTESLDERMEGIKTALAQHAPQQVEFLSHSLKGSFSNLGLTRLASGAASVEDQSRRSSETVLKALFSELVQMVAAFKPSLLQLVELLTQQNQQRTAKALNASALQAALRELQEAIERADMQRSNQLMMTIADAFGAELPVDYYRLRAALNHKDAAAAMACCMRLIIKH